MIQEISPHHYDNTFKNQAPTPDSIALYYQDRNILLKIQPGIIDFPRFRDLERLNDDIYEDYIYLFSIDQVPYYLVKNVNLEPLSMFRLENTESLREANPQYQAFAGITGYQLYKWYSMNKFCGRCGAMTRHGMTERVIQCDTCNNLIYPKLSPAVIIGVTKGEKILLTKYANRSFTNYALVAGYVEIGESLEECVKREVLEEVGLTVTNIRYYKSQPWSFTDTVLMGFYCDVVGEEDIVLDEEELSVATWYHKADIPVEPKRDSLTNEMMMHFRGLTKII